MDRALKKAGARDVLAAEVRALRLELQEAQTRMIAELELAAGPHTHDELVAQVCGRLQEAGHKVECMVGVAFELLLLFAMGHMDDTEGDLDELPKLRGWFQSGVETVMGQTLKYREKHFPSTFDVS